MVPLINTEAVVAYAHCPCKAYLLLYGHSKDKPHEYVRILEDKKRGRQAQYLAVMCHSVEIRYR